MPSWFMKSAITTKKIWNETSGFVPFNWSFDMINQLKKVLQGGMRQLQNFEWISFSSLYFWNDNGSKWIETSLNCCWNKFPIESYMFNSFLVRCECTLKWIGKISSRTISNALKSIVWRPRLVNCETVPGNFFWYPPQYGSPLFGKWRKKALS